MGNGAVVQLGGFEPPTSGSTIRRSNQLSYSCMWGARARGAEIMGATRQKQATEYRALHPCGEPRGIRKLRGI
jgi:hypothetical protein